MFNFLSTIIDRLFEAGKAVPGLRRDQKRKTVLREMLSHPDYKWRGIGKLATAAGTSEERTRELLISLDARASTGSGSEVWGLISRVGHG